MSFSLDGDFEAYPAAMTYTITVSNNKCCRNGDGNCVNGTPAADGSCTVGLKPRPRLLRAVLPEFWPTWAEEFAAQGTAADRGVGDVIARLHGDVLAWMRKNVGCGACDQQRLNILYPDPKYLKEVNDVTIR